MTDSSSAPRFVSYFGWQRDLMRDDVLRKMAGGESWDIRYTAVVIASFRPHGSWVAARTVADEIGCSLNTVKRHRGSLIELGWFRVVRRDRRSVTVAIAIPATHLGGSLDQRDQSQDQDQDPGHETPLRSVSSRRDRRLAAMHAGADGISVTVGGVTHWLVVGDGGEITGCRTCGLMWHPADIPPF